MTTIELRGVSWDHPRGHDCMVATAAAYRAVAPGVVVRWETRSLQDFADFPVQKLAETYDLLIVDHPFVGFAARDGCLLPLDGLLDPAVLADQAANSVGPTHRSYLYAGRQWALANDAAGHVAAWRPDLLDELGGLPRTWDEVLLTAAIRSGAQRARVGIPLIPVDALMSFCSICAAFGAPPFADPAQVVERRAGRHALGVLAALTKAAHPASLRLNPPRMLDLAAETDEVAFVPLLFGYSNYARPGFRRNLIRFGGLPLGSGAEPAGGILGGAGIAVSRHAKHPDAAAAYAAFVVEPEVQRGIYFASGGQPGHRAAWTDPAVNAASSRFFADTLASLDRAFLRPRYDGFMAFQEAAGEAIHEWLVAGGVNPNGLLDRLDDRYRASNPPAASCAESG
jgi:multiple sugar transport system substrate-binding protein